MKVKRWFVLLLMTAMAAPAATNLVSFTNLAGVKFLNVQPLRTNREEFVFKVNGKLGFQVERLTNLPAAVRYDLEAQERAAVAKAEEARRLEYEKRLAELADRLTYVTNRLAELKTLTIDVGFWRDHFSYCREKVAELKEERKQWDGPEDLRTRLEEMIAATEKTRDETERIYRQKYAVYEKERERDLEAERARRAAEIEPWTPASLGIGKLGQYYAAATEAVKLRLKAPRSAVFEGKGKVVAESKEGRVRLIGNVDSQNGFGALLRTVFIVEFVNDKVVSVEFPGQDK